MVRVCVVSLREEDKGMGVGMGGGRGEITGHNTPPPQKKTHFDRQQGNPVGIWVRVGLGGSGRAWYLLAVNSAPSVCVCGGGGGNILLRNKHDLGARVGEGRSKFSALKFSG